MGVVTGEVVTFILIFRNLNFSHPFGVPTRFARLVDNKVDIFVSMEPAGILLEVALNRLNALELRHVRPLLLRTLRPGPRRLLYLPSFDHKLLQHVVFQNRVIEKFEIFEILHAVFLPC